MSRSNRENNSGFHYRRAYKDPTADIAIANVMREQRRYRDDEELYVYDQSCDNCRYYCDWDDEESNNGCRNYERPDYEKYPASHWCCDWKGRKRRRGGRR